MLVLPTNSAPDPPVAVHPEVETRLREIASRTSAAWPDINLDEEAFIAHVHRHLKAEDDPIDALTCLRASDLYLACACSRGDPRALRAFEAQFGNELRIVRTRLRQPEVEGPDFEQGCRQRLFAPPRPKIGEYSGRGDLRNWLRVTLVRMLVDHQRSTKQRDAHEQVADGGPPLDVPTPQGDVELDFLKRKYGTAFRAAFEDAAMTLEPAERNLLRQHFAEGLTIDELGALYGIHRATAARRVAKARTNLLLATRGKLMDALGLDRAELDSVMRMIESTVHVSVQRIFSA